MCVRGGAVGEGGGGGGEGGGGVLRGFATNHFVLQTLKSRYRMALTER